MIELRQLRMIGVPRTVGAWFQTTVQVVGDFFHVPVWLVQDAMGTRYTADMPPVKFDVAVDPRRQLLILQPLPYVRGVALRPTEYRAVASKLPAFYRVKLATIREIFLVQPPARFTVVVNRKDAALIVKMKNPLEPSPCIK